MITKRWADLKENPKNYKEATPEEEKRLQKQMLMGDHSTALITPDDMLIDGNNRKKWALQAGWETVECRVLSFEQDPEKGFYALLDGVVVKDKDGNIPYFYSSVDAGIQAYALSRNGNQSHYQKDPLKEILKQYGLQADMFTANIHAEQDLKTLLTDNKPPKLQLIIDCQSPEELSDTINKLASVGVVARQRKKKDGQPTTNTTSEQPTA